MSSRLPRLWPLRIAAARLRPYNASLLTRVTMVAILFGAFLYGDFLLFRRIISAITQIESLSPFFALGLLENLLGLVFLVSFLVLFFSSLTSAIASFFTDADLEIDHAAPVGKLSIALKRWWRTFLRSSYLIVAFLLPLFLALAFRYDLGWTFMGAALVNLLLLVATPVSAASIVVILLVRFFPVGRVQQIVVTLAVLVITLTIMGFRVARPERLFLKIDTDDLVQVLKLIELPASDYYPSGWLAGALLAWPAGAAASSDSIKLAALAGSSFLVFLLIARSHYFIAFVRAKETLAPTALGSGLITRTTDRLSMNMHPQSRALFRKEVRIITRDVGQWSQLFMMVALLFIYLYNIQTLPLEGDVRATFVAYMNLAMAGFVMAALCLRFAYPSVSAEGRAFWTLQTAPLSSRRMLVVKTLIFIVPLSVLALLLVSLGNVMLAAPAQVWSYTVVGGLLMTITLVSLGVGMGGISPNFTAENPLEVGLSLGGFAYMAISMTYVGTMLLLLARPLRRFVLYVIFGFSDGLSAISQALPLLMAVSLSAVLTLLPLGLAERSLRRRV